MEVKPFREISNIAQLSAMVIADRTLSASGHAIHGICGKAKLN